MDALSLTKEARIYNGAKTVSSVTAAGKTNGIGGGNQARPLSHILCSQNFHVN